MRKFATLIIAVFCFGVLAKQASAGVAASAQFNTFEYTQAGPLTNMSGLLSTTFNIDPFNPFILAITVSGPSGTTDLAPILTGPEICEVALDVRACTFETTVEIDGVVPPGSSFTATGEIKLGEQIVDTAEDSFTAVPEPAPLALIGAALLGIGLARRRLRA